MHPMRHVARHLLLLYVLTVALEVGLEAAPSPGERIEDSQMDASYIESVMRMAKAAEMGNYMNESINPCDNFYNFACGNWARINPANSVNEITTGLFERLTKALNRKVTHMLKNTADALDTPEDTQVKRFFKSCMRLRELKNYQQRLEQLIGEFGEMPVLAGDKWQESSFDWLETTARMANRYGIMPIIGVEVLKDFTNNQVNVVYIGQQEFLLESRGMYLDEHTVVYRDAYRNQIAKTLKFVGLSGKLARDTAAELLDFEVELAHGLMDENKGLDVGEMSDLTTVADMQRRYAPTLDIERLVNISLGEHIADSVYEFNEQYQLNLMKVLQRTTPRIVANYIFYSLIDAFHYDLDKKPAKQESDCIDATKKHFAKELDNMIYRRYNTNATANDIELIWHQLKSTFKNTLESGDLSWVANKTRRYAVKKLDAMTLQINSYAGDNFTAEFAGLELQDYDYVENVRQTRIVATRNMREELHKPAKPLEAGELLSYTPANILVENTIKVPVALLQPYYLWATSYPNAIKFGTLASLIGHELIHGFDDTGRKFDINGNVNDWWEEESTERFQERQKCFTRQYSKYIYNGRNLPESEAQSENIADNGGVRLAYAAYLNWYEDAVRSGQTIKETLPTLDYTAKQLFFISYAQIWCNDAHPRVRNLQTSTDQHVPGQFRVIGPLSNFKKFASEFNCAQGTKMNPITKCEIY